MPPFHVDPEKHTICDVIRRWAEIQPNASALIDEDGVVISYGNLVEKLDLSHRFAKQNGLGRGDRIGTVYSDGLEMAVIMLGVIDGFTAVPLNPQYTVSEFRQHFQERKVSTIFSGPEARTACYPGTPQEQEDRHVTIQQYRRARGQLAAARRHQRRPRPRPGSWGGRPDG